MGIMRRLFSVGTGLAAGLLAYKLINRYEKKIQLEGEYRVIAPEEEQAGPQEPQGGCCAPARSRAGRTPGGPAEGAPPRGERRPQPQPGAAARAF